MNTLYIDTRDNSRIIISIDNGKKKYTKESLSHTKNSQAALLLIVTILKEAKLKVSDLNEISVETGPGSYTGLRVGVSIANALSLSALVKVNGKKLGEIEIPNY